LAPQNQSACPGEMLISRLRLGFGFVCSRGEFISGRRFLTFRHSLFDWTPFPAFSGLRPGPAGWSVGPGRVAAVSTDAKKKSKALRKKTFKQQFRYTRPDPKRLGYQRDGDFPLQVRPSALVIRDLQDSSFDIEAAEGNKLPKKIKPHEVREALRHSAPDRVHGTQDDKADVKTLKDAGRQGSAIPEFDMERDVGEEEATDFALQKARAEARAAQRRYKWVPNPHGSTPGPLGQTPAAEAKYFERYYKGDDIEKRPHAGPSGSEEFREARSPRQPRERLSPKQFWYLPGHTTPLPADVGFLNSRDLKFSMVNEAHLVRKWRETRPEGRAAGMPLESRDLWMAFGHRAADLAEGRPAPIAKPDIPENFESRKDGQLQRCSLSSTLRYVQCLASVQAGPYSALQRLVGRAFEHIDDMKPRELFFLLQALSRLRLKPSKLFLILQRMSLTWGKLSDKQFVKAANAVAKLDIASNAWAKPLKLALVKWLPRLHGRQLALLKGITVMELLDDTDAMRIYLEQCERMRTHFWYSRHLQLVELHAHLVQPKLWEVLSENVRLFLQDVRIAAERSRDAQNTARNVCTPSTDASSDDSGGSSDDENEGDSLEQGSFDRNSFASALHADISRVLTDVVRLEHQNRLAAGALTVDMCHLPTMTVIDAAESWQFYLRSPQPTAQARRRHEILRAMGFRLVIVPYYKWSALQSDEEKATFIQGVLPSELLRGVNSAAHSTHTSHAASGSS